MAILLKSPHIPGVMYVYGLGLFSKYLRTRIRGLPSFHYVWSATCLENFSRILLSRLHVHLHIRLFLKNYASAHRLCCLDLLLSSLLYLFFLFTALTVFLFHCNLFLYSFHIVLEWNDPIEKIKRSSADLLCLYTESTTNYIHTDKI